MDTQLKLQNERVRVTRWTLSQGEETGLHKHHHDYVVIPLLDARMAVHLPDGTVTSASLSAGAPYFREAGAEHNVRNPDVGSLDFIEVELLG